MVSKMANKLGLKQRSAILDQIQGFLWPNFKNYIVTSTDKYQKILYNDLCAKVILTLCWNIEVFACALC